MTLILPAHVMRAENLPGFARARHAHRKLAGFCLAQAMRTRNAPRFSPYLACLLAGAQQHTPPRGHSSKRKGATDGSGGAPDPACRQPPDLREEGTAGAQEGLSGHQGRPHDANQRHPQLVRERAVTPILSQERSEKHVYLCPRSLIIGVRH